MLITEKKVIRINMYGILDNGDVIASFAAPMTVIDNTPTFGGDTLSLRRIVERRPAQRWEIETNLAPLSYDAQNLLAVLMVNGNSSSIGIRMPQNYGAKQARTANDFITGTGSVSSTLVSLTGVSGLLPRGTFVKFSNHNKIYMTLTNLNGNGVVTVHPPLRTLVSGHNVAYRDDVDGFFYADFDNIRGMSYVDGILMDLGRMRFLEVV